MQGMDRAVVRTSSKVVVSEATHQAAISQDRRILRNALLSILAIAALDFLVPIGPSVRLLYMLPAWLLVERHERDLAYIALGVGVLLHAAIGFRSESQMLANSLVHVTVGVGLIFRLNSLLVDAKAVHTKAGKDALTGAANRKTLEDYGEAQLDNCVLHDVPFTVAVIDCDQFKKLNDTHGHAYGDEVLKTLVRCINAAIGKHGRVGRFGGDEFVVALPGISYEDADEMLRKASNAFGDATLVKGGRASCSIGLAEGPHDGVFWPRLLEAADDDMYRRKLSRQAGNLFEITA